MNTFPIEIEYIYTELTVPIGKRKAAPTIFRDFLTLSIPSYESTELSSPVAIQSYETTIRFYYKNNQWYLPSDWFFEVGDLVRRIDPFIEVSNHYLADDMSFNGNHRERSKVENEQRFHDYFDQLILVDGKFYSKIDEPFVQIHPLNDNCMFTSIVNWVDHKRSSLIPVGYCSLYDYHYHYDEFIDRYAQGLEVISYFDIVEISMTKSYFTFDYLPIWKDIRTGRNASKIDDLQKQIKSLTWQLESAKNSLADLENENLAINQDVPYSKEWKRRQHD